MALGDSYATLAALKTYLTGLNDTNDDTKLTLALDAASRSIEGATGRQFNLDTGLTQRIYFATAPTVALVDDFSSTTGLVVETDMDDDGIYELTWASSDYQLEPINGIINGVAGFPYSRILAVGAHFFPVAGRRGFGEEYGQPWVDSSWPLVHRRASLRVTATFGWPAVPAAVQQACIVLAEELFKLKDAPFGVAGWGEYGQIRVRENPKVAELLRRYTRNSVVFA